MAPISNRVLVLAIGAIALTVAATSAKAQSGTPAAPIWTGLYAGIHGGGMNTEVNQSIGIDHQTTDQRGGMFGGHLGYNYQFNSALVGGIEGDINRGQGDEHGKYLSVRGRLGWAFDRVMLYGTVGYGGGMKLTAIARGPGGATASVTHSLDGIVYGAGVEGKLFPHVSLRAEVMNYSTGEQAYVHPFNGNVMNVDSNVLTYRLGLTFHLNR